VHSSQATLFSHGNNAPKYGQNSLLGTMEDTVMVVGLDSWNGSGLQDPQGESDNRSIFATINEGSAADVWSTGIPVAFEFWARQSRLCELLVEISTTYTNLPVESGKLR